MNTIIVLLILAGLIYFWLDSMKSKEVAMAYAAKECQSINVQLLDQTVSLKSIKPIRDRRGRLVFKRIYTFDFSIHGSERSEGRVILEGIVMKQIQLDYEDGMVIDSSAVEKSQDDKDL